MMQSIQSCKRTPQRIEIWYKDSEIINLVLFGNMDVDSDFSGFIVFSHDYHSDSELQNTFSTPKYHLPLAVWDSV